MSLHGTKLEKVVAVTEATNEYELCFGGGRKIICNADSASTLPSNLKTPFKIKNERFKKAGFIC